MGIHARRRALAAAAVALLVLVALVFAGSGGAAGPPDGAARLVPSDALAFVDVATDTGRDGVRRALELARRFPAFSRLRAGLVGRLTQPGCGLGTAGSGGREMAVAILGAGSLVLLDTGHDGPVGPVRRCGTASSQRLGRFLAVGSAIVLSDARAVLQGRTASLAQARTYDRARSGLPAGRFATGYVSAAGVRGLLATRGGLAGMAAALLDDPHLVAVGLAAETRAPGLRVTLHELHDGARRGPSHDTGLLDRAPAGAVAALDTGDLGGALGRLGVLFGDLDPSERQGLARALRGEVALWLTPVSGSDAPTLTLVAEHGDAAAVPRSVGGRSLTSRMIGGRLTVSTRPDGITAAAAGGASLRDSPAARAVLGDAPGKAAALGFLDFSELLRLGEQTGLDSSQAYRGIASDLRKVRSVGAVSTGDADQTTLQVELSIP